MGLAPLLGLFLRRMSLSRAQCSSVRRDVCGLLDALLFQEQRCRKTI